MSGNYLLGHLFKIGYFRRLHVKMSEKFISCEVQKFQKMDQKCKNVKNGPKIDQKVRIFLELENGILVTCKTRHAK